MAVFYLTLLYFFIWLFLVRLQYLKIGENFPELPVYLLLLFILAYFLLSLVNLYLVRRKKGLAVKIRLGYNKKYQGKLIVNVGAGLLPVAALIYLYPRSAIIPLLIAVLIASAIGLTIYQGKKNIKNQLPVFSTISISIIISLVLTPANPAYVMVTAFILSSAIILLSNLIWRNKKIPLYIGEQNFYHALTLLFLIVLSSWS